MLPLPIAGPVQMRSRPTVHDIEGIVRKPRPVTGNGETDALDTLLRRELPGCIHHCRREVNSDDAGRPWCEPECPPAVPAPEVEDRKVFSEGKNTDIERFLREIDVIIIGIVSL